MSLRPVEKRGKQSRGFGDCFPAERGISLLAMTNPRPSNLGVTKLPGIMENDLSRQRSLFRASDRAGPGNRASDLKVQRDGNNH